MKLETGMGKSEAEADSGCSRCMLRSEISCLQAWAFPLDAHTPEMIPEGVPVVAAHVCKSIGNKKCIIPAAVVITVFIIIIIIILAVKKPEPCSPCPHHISEGAACPDFWIGNRGKCFYTSKEEMNWSLSLTTCTSLNASLAVIDSQEELDFWVHIFHPFHYWMGLSRKVNEVWKWSNGTEFKNQFPVRGDGFCAYINEKGADSILCSTKKLFFCSQPESCKC